MIVGQVAPNFRAVSILRWLLFQRSSPCISALCGQTIILEVKMCAGQAYGQLPEVIAVGVMSGNGPGGKK